MDSLSNVTTERFRECMHDSLSYVHIWISGAIIAFAIYCVNVIVTLGYLRMLSIQLAKKKKRSRRRWILTVYVVVAFILGTIAITGSIKGTMDILSRNCDGNLKLEQYDDQQNSTNLTSVMMVTTCFMLSAWAADILTIWRFMAIYYDFRLVKWCIFILSMLLQMGSMAFGVLHLLNIDMTKFTSLINSNLIIFEVFTLFQNTMLITLIAGRLLFLCYRIRRVLGKSYGSEYIKLTSILVECHVLLGAGQVALLGASLGTSYGSSMYQVLGQIQVLAPIVPLYQVEQGRMCNLKTIAEITLKFKNDTKETSS
ncbi:hypothetical protein BDQ17DRAFT_977772 [Cyathus striatus]|nr:hypothetical protein BDQ17DRAFT_977772 [Cyathus striatus]